MRQDGPWFSKNTKGSDTWAIVDKVDNLGNVLQESGITYSCEEFPAASWVEGGNGPNRNTPSFTRCVPYTCKFCPSGTKSEQTWQSFAHRAVSRPLQEAIDHEYGGLGWNDKETIALFRFTMMKGEGAVANGVAAQVVWLDDDVGELGSQDIIQAKRSISISAGNATEPETAAALNARLNALVVAGKVRNYTIFANDTEITYNTTTPWGAFRQHDLERRLAKQQRQRE